MTIKIIPRDEWGARPPRTRTTIPTPSRELWLHHTVGEYHGPGGMRRLQEFHQNERGFRDVGYSVVVDRRTLDVYEGAGIGVLGAHTKGHNSVGHAIAVTGNFDELRPTPDLIDLLAELVAHGHTQGWWPNQLSGGHRDTKATSCPGGHLYRQIPTINRIALTIGDTTVPDPDFVARIKQATLTAKYSPTDDLDRLAANVEEMGVGIMKLIGDNALLKDLVERSKADQDLAAAVRALVETEKSG